jgi:hypothetical protein
MFVDGLGLPRFWAAVWTLAQPADLAPSTLSKKLSHIESFYQHAEQVLGFGGWNDVLADFDVEALGRSLEGYFLTTRHRPSITPASEGRWLAALQFVTDFIPKMP